MYVILKVDYEVLVYFKAVCYIFVQYIIICETGVCDSTCNTLLSVYSKAYVKRPLSKRPKPGFQDRLLLNAGQKYCRMLPLEHSAILLTFIKLPLDLCFVYF